MLETLCFIAALAVGAGCPAGGDSKDGKDAKKDAKTKTASKDDKKDAKAKADKKDDKKADTKKDAKADDGGGEEPPPTPATPEEVAKFYQDCWAAFGKDWDAFGKCYAEDAVSVDSMGEYNGRDKIVQMSKDMSAAFSDSVGELQLTLVKDNNVVGVARVGGKHSGPMKMPGMAEIPATNKSYGVLMAHVVQLDDAKRLVTKEWAFFDAGSMMGQLGLSKAPHRKIVDKDWENKQTVIAKGDETETKNVEAHNAFVEAFNKHDVKAIGDALADDAKWSEQAAPADMNKKQFLKDLPAMFKAFSDVKITNETTWGAGDYVVSIGKWEGTNDGDWKAMKLKKTGKQVSIPFTEVTQYKDGKIAANWLFYDGMIMATQLGLVPPPGGDKPAGDEKKDDAKADEKKADEKKTDAKKEEKKEDKKADEKKADEKKGG
jgi:predicted ester cyclase